MIAKLILLAGAAVASGMLLYLFLRWERSGREHWVVFLLLGMLVVESSLWGDETTVPQGLFHPGTGSLEFRLPEVIITVALVARLLIKGTPKSIGFPALLWLSVAAWWALEAVEGILRHNSLVKLPYEAKAIIYVMAAYALASGVPIRRYLEGRGFERLLQWSALSATVLILLDAAHKSYAVDIPLLRLVNFGVLGTDAATIFVSVGVIGFLLELNKDRRSRLNLLCTVPLALSPFFAFQRAVLITLGTVVTVVVVVGIGSTARERLRIRSGEVAVAALAVVGVVLAVSVIPAITSQKSVTGPLASTYNSTLGATLNSEAKQESAQDRINKWSVALADAQQHWFLGQGLGFEYSYFQAGPNQYIVTDLTENIGLDLWLRTGLIGLGLFLLALVTALVNGFATWRMHPDPTVAVLALALFAVVLGLVAKGQVESIFENYRLATVFGLSLGMLRSAVTSGGGGSTAMRTYQATRHHEVI
ncbi:MAG: O-antigen ligase family protein [Acidimicrobiales bacterium]